MGGITPKFFGQYLLEKGVLSKDELISSINYQKSKILKLGEIALDKGFISEKNIAKIHNEQKKTDMRFGDLAVDMGIITLTQLEEIITIQKNNHIYLGEAIVECGYMSNEEVDKELGLFKEEQKSVPPIEVMIKEDIPNKQLVEVSVDLTEKMMRRVGDMISKAGQLRVETTPLKNLGFVSILEYKGDVSSRYILNLSKDVAHQIAKRTFKKDSLPYDEELLSDTTSEFVNVVCGNVRSKMLELGKKIEILPPSRFTVQEKDTIELLEGEQAIIIPGYTTLGDYEIVITCK